jgi:2-keto-4-pentenoate hydratase/2-oxohepta-3-ene-1,7-dioic acid hydratase in catechol pathway
MRVGNLDGRAVLVRGQECADIEQASGGHLPDDPLALLERWVELQATDFSQAQFAPLAVERLGAPVPNPRQVFALAVNYREHAAEARTEAPETPYVFTKFPSCITGPFAEVRLPSNRTDWEVELVAVIGKRAGKVSASDAWSVIAGLTVGQDISERRVQFRKPIPHLSVAKSFPTFGPIGPVLVTVDEFGNPDDLALRCAIDGEEMQSSRTSEMVFSVPQLVESISAMVTLLPGDVIFTGTPSGVGSTRDPRRYLEPGQLIESEVEGIGAMRNRCLEA